ncbi:hypothetical protein N7U66_17985 [Lacinutrix neustonica]|uniref:Uncharacterized protein n=1 Tax=Lacinutrix neustonica TaxID=2980107 RepID=A0A9E8SD63_9FLAO|nr:hypothetical protein [Lacinutrix neustonica]WAC01761.1 hypothetical protein N7U66_17985 [Lacinutrix neustonica]
MADAIIMVCSQSGYWKLYKGFNRLRMYAFWNVMIPITTPLFGYFPAKKLGLFENLPKHVTYQWRKWGIQSDYMLSEFSASDLYFKTVTCNMLSLSFPRDKFAPKLAVDWLAHRFENAAMDRQHIIPKHLILKMFNILVFLEHCIKHHFGNSLKIGLKRILRCLY